MLQFTLDKYKCASIAPSSLPSTQQQFQEKLKKTFQHFSQQKVRGFWMSIQSRLNHLIPIAMKDPYKCQFHHTDSNKSLMLIRWLSHGPCRFPTFCTHIIGAGGLIFNKKTGKILLMQEKWAKKPVWKISGGQVDVDEWIQDGAMREVFEETGVKCQAIGILSTRELLKFRHGRADMYFVVLGQTEQEEINICSHQTLKADWFDFQDCMDQKFEKSVSFTFVVKVLQEIVEKDGDIKNGKDLFSKLKDKYVAPGKVIDHFDSKGKPRKGIFRGPKI